MTVRCKFRCQSKREYEGWAGSTAPKSRLYDYAFVAVTGGSDENNRFFAYTPQGTLNVCSVHSGQFVVGAEYYLDIITTPTKADEVVASV